MAGRVYLIGDEEAGLTIVTTNPPMVVHYTHKDLEDAIKGGDPELNMAAIVRDAFAVLRGTNLDELESMLNSLRTTNHGAYDLNQENAALRELYNIETIARTIRAGHSVHNVDFCLSFELSDATVTRGKRKNDPVKSILEYLSDPKKAPPPPYPIDQIDKGGLDPIDPWNPDANGNPPSVPIRQRK